MTITIGAGKGLARIVSLALAKEIGMRCELAMPHLERAAVSMIVSTSGRPGRIGAGWDLEQERRQLGPSAERKEA